MINFDALNKAGKIVEDALIDIRKSIGAPATDYVANKEGIKITDKELKEQAKLNPGSPIIMHGRFYFTYIKDHSLKNDTYHQEDLNKAIKLNTCFVKGHKVHFYYCRTLEDMEIKEKKHRYRVTTITSNYRTIDILYGADDVSVRLPFCKNCLKVFRGWEVWNSMDEKAQNNMAERTDAEKLMDDIKTRHGNNDPAINRTQEQNRGRPLGNAFARGLKSSAQPSGYPKNWDKISAAFRKKYGYKCEFCGVVCEKHTHLIDAHHKDGDKSNSSYKNLECLCVYCHAQQPFHEHYEISEKDMSTLRSLWQEQKIPAKLQG